MNSKIKNTILEGILIGTIALNGCVAKDASNKKTNYSKSYGNYSFQK